MDDKNKIAGQVLGIIYPDEQNPPNTEFTNDLELMLAGEISEEEMYARVMRRNAQGGAV